MRVGNTKSGRAAVSVATLALLATSLGSASVAAQDASGEPVVVCELAYYTGEFQSYGPSLTNDVRFAVEDIVNTDPPLGRPWELISEDIGDSFEGQAAKTCIEQHGAEILVSIAHQYRTYRDYMMEVWQENDSPLGPSVHGGAIPGNLGGKPAEPIFRAQGLDQGLGVYGAQYANLIGAEDVVIFATEVEGFQLAADAEEGAAELLGMNVLERIDSPAQQSSYRTEAQRIADLDPDAVLIQAGSVESATLIREAAEAGLSLNWIGETGWSEVEFINSLTADPIASQQGIGFATFAPNLDSPAFEYFQPLWDGQTDCASGVAECPPYDATNQYATSTYDLLVQTALAVEAGGSYKASDWAPAMNLVGEAPGEVCYTYPDCLALIRDGQDIDYEGITGPGDYTAGGVNAVTPAYLPFLEDGSIGEPVILDPVEALDLLDQVKTEAVCEPEDPPNECTW
jgi:ABC-type branched-subunit amino acid transport system substrate-binding protein